jgi:glutamate formiminotransferase/formiminotetrahydrofolate cyclodeaminase
MQLMECVPNFSEGRDKKVIHAIAGMIAGIPHAQILDIDMGFTVNRTVITFIGPPDAVSAAAFAAIECAVQKIDMRNHQGLHPRLGSTDVCPFVPIKGIAENEALVLVDNLAQRVGNELQIPVYLYEKSAKNPNRKNLAQIRSGQYEQGAIKIKRPDWQPDYGPAVFNSRTGVTVMGIRDYLIAFNINLKGNVLNDARKIVHQIRANRIKGTLQFCRVLSWYLPEINRTQVTTNLTNYKVTGMHAVFEEVKRLAESGGLQVTGSELVGLVPHDALLETGRFYAGTRDLLPEELFAVAVQKLNLNDLYPFDPKKKILGPF